MIDGINADFAVGMQNLQIGQNDSHVRDAPHTIFEECQVNGLCFFNKINRFAEENLLRRFSGQACSDEFKNHLHQATVVDAKRRATTRQRRGIQVAPGDFHQKLGGRCDITGKNRLTAKRIIHALQFKANPVKIRQLRAERDRHKKVIGHDRLHQLQIIGKMLVISRKFTGCHGFYLIGRDPADEIVPVATDFYPLSALRFQDFQQLAEQQLGDHFAAAGGGRANRNNTQWADSVGHFFDLRFKNSEFRFQIYN